MIHTREGLARYAKQLDDPDAVAYALYDPESKCTTFSDGAMFIQTGIGDQYFVTASVAARGRELAARKREQKMIRADNLALKQTEARVADANNRVAKANREEQLIMRENEMKFRKRVALIAGTVSVSAVAYYLANGGLEQIARSLK